ncbi:facilitated trehalose transporter Tret1-like [Osmia bicornis bicornis]|uniref:facilitated trehalose transporter Tret1-like n=1 Tax=Osmia bicornis bicornis TaxID=1437191 RepID=UPI001EAF7E96|nr:facilitated trehalose transporter Tret1-like [Osmia bicornis bicornis]
MTLVEESLKREMEEIEDVKVSVEWIDPSRLDHEAATMTENVIEPVVIEEKPVEKEKTEECKSRLHLNQIIASFIATLTLLSCGLCIGWPTIFLHGKESDVPLTPDSRLLVAVAVLIGACAGPILSGLLIDRIGRKWFLYMTTIPILAGWILIFVAKKWLLLFMGRLVAGLSVGAIYTVVPIYTGEITEPRVRGAASGIMAVMLNLGYIFTYGVGPILGRKNLAVINLIPVIVFGLTFVWIPESPYYYLKKQKQKDAELSLTWLRGKLNNEKEIEEIKTFIKSEEECSIKKLTVPTNRKALLILMLLFAGQQLSGLLAIESYTRVLLPKIDFNVDIRVTLLIISSLTLVTSLVTTLVVDKIGRKVVFLISAYGATICLLVVGVYCYLYGKVAKLNELTWVPLIVILLHSIVFSFGLGSIPAIMSSELFPMNVKSWAITFANIFSFLLALIVAGCYEFVIDAFGYYIIFWALGILELIITITLTVIMPETSRKSFIEIQQMLKGKSNAPSADKTNSP